MRAEREMDMTASNGVDEMLAHYQLAHDPFAARAPGFKFFAPQRKTVLAQLHHLARFSGQVLVTMGPEGSGKSILRQALVASSNKDAVQSVVMAAKDVIAETALLAAVAQAIGAQERSAAGILTRSEQLHQTGMQLHIVVDDAHLLEPQGLQTLVDISQAGGKSAPRVFLFADERLRDPLAQLDAPEKSQWVHVIELQPFTLEESRDYLGQRLEAAGQGIELLSDEQVTHIHRQGGGWPGRINEAGRRSMLAEMEEQPAVARERKQSVLPVRSLVALVLVGIGVAAAWMMGDRPSEPTRTVLQLPEPVVEVDVTDTRAGPDQAVLMMPGEQDMMEAVSEVPDDLEISEPEPSLASPEPVPPVVQTQPEPPPQPETAAPTPAPTAPPSTAQSEPQTAAPTAPATAGTTQSGSASGEQWYRQRPASEYALQVLGTRSRQAAVDFVGKHAGVGELRYFETRHEGQPWFVVTQGAYAGREQAQQALARLPQPLRDQKPWPRSFGSIQQSMP